MDQARDPELRLFDDIPWRRVIAEGTIIVASILLAFWIDAKWQENLIR